jgi:hypothetical protein
MAPMTGYLTSKSTWWDNLQQSDKEACVDATCQYQVTKLSAWGSQGKVLDKWNQEAFPKIIKLVNISGNKDYVFKYDKTKQRIADFDLYMIASDGAWKRAQPTVLVRCTDPRAAKRTVLLLESSNIIRGLQLGFNFIANPGKSDATLPADAGESTAENDASESLCGARIVIPPDPADLDHERTYATMGGLLTVDDVYYGITAAHVFLESSQVSQPSSTSSEAYSDDTDGHDSDSDYVPEESSGGSGDEMESLQIVRRFIYLDKRTTLEGAGIPPASDSLSLTNSDLDEHDMIGEVATRRLPGSSMLTVPQVYETTIGHL